MPTGPSGVIAFPPTFITALGGGGQPFWEAGSGSAAYDSREPPFGSTSGSSGVPVDPWDTLIIAGVATPGKCQLSGDKGHRLDKKMAAGLDGATTTHLGTNPADIICTLWLWTAAHWTRYQQLIPVLQPKPGKGAPTALSVYHPQLAALSIKSLYLKNIGLLEQDSPGYMRVKIRFQEWRPSDGKSVTLTPKGTTDFTKGVPLAGANGGSASSRIKLGFNDSAFQLKPPSQTRTGP